YKPPVADTGIGSRLARPDLYPGFLLRRAWGVKRAAETAAHSGRGRTPSSGAMRSTIRAVAGAALAPAVMWPAPPSPVCGSNSDTSTTYLGASIGKAPTKE